MPKKKQVTFHSNTPGKYIPRDDTPSASVFRSGTNANRFNSKMVELLASSSISSTTVNNENEPIPNITKSSQDDQILSPTPEISTMDSSHVHSKVLRRRIVTMLESLRRRSGTHSPPTSPKITSSHMGSKSKPITFGQLRQATTSPTPQPSLSSSTLTEEVLLPKIVTARSYTDLVSINTSDRQSYHPSLVTDTRSDLIPTTRMSTNRSSSKHSTNSERSLYSSSHEQLLEQHNIAPRKNEQNEEEQQQQTKSPLTVDEILATYYSKVKIPTTAETIPSSHSPSYSNNNMGFYMPSSTSGWNPSQTNSYQNPLPRQLLLNEQNRNRPPPPSYSSSIASGHRPPSTTNNLAQHLIRPPVPSSIRENVYSGSQIPQHLLSGNSPVRPVSPSYESPTSNIERSHSALSSVNRPNYTSTNPPQAGFDREFSLLLYGKEVGRNRHQRQKRKALSDPVKKSVEEAAGRSIEKNHRRLTTHLNKTDTVKEEEESTSDSNEIDKHEQKNSFPQKYFQRQTNENNHESAKKAIVPANPVLKRRIPSFLRVYSQASSSNNILQWHLYSFSELESFDAMMKKLYKDENLVRVQMYENYRALLSSTLTSKISKNKNNNDDDDGITTTAL